MHRATLVGDKLVVLGGSGKATWSFKEVRQPLGACCGAGIGPLDVASKTRPVRSLCRAMPMAKW